MPHLSQELLPSQQSVATAVLRAAVWLRIALQTIGGAVIAVGAALTVTRSVRGFLGRLHISSNDVRLGFARYLALALEFQLAADIHEGVIAVSRMSAAS